MLSDVHKILRLEPGPAVTSAGLKLNCLFKTYGKVSHGSVHMRYGYVVLFAGQHMFGVLEKSVD